MQRGVGGQNYHEDSYFGLYSQYSLLIKQHNERARCRLTLLVCARTLNSLERRKGFNVNYKRFNQVAFFTYHESILKHSSKKKFSLFSENITS